MQVSDDLFLGPAFAGGTGMDGSTSGPTNQSLGVGPLGRIYVFDIVPAAAAANNICLAQAIAGAADAVIAGALASGGVATLDVPRSLQMVSTGAGDTTQTVTVRGFDQYGQALTETRTLNGTTIVQFQKAFKRVARVTVSAAMAGNLTLGTNNVLGLPVYLPNVAYLATVKWDSTLADNAATVVAGVTSAATATTGDVRGTITPAGNAPDGARRLVCAILLNALACGPNATRAGAFGVAQFGS